MSCNLAMRSTYYPNIVKDYFCAVAKCMVGCSFCYLKSLTFERLKMDFEGTSVMKLVDTPMFCIVKN